MKQVKVKREQMFSDKWYRGILPFDSVKSQAKVSFEVVKFPKHKGFSGTGIKI